MSLIIKPNLTYHYHEEKFDFPRDSLGFPTDGLIFRSLLDYLSESTDLNFHPLESLLKV